ncbi:MAG TPA: DNA ligase D, partial [Flavitalea sp.]|nr:DNA ligase D [Flavitalea sp.]
MPATAQTGKINIGEKSAFPVDIKPMLATLVTNPLDEPGWIYEIKWDGYRALSYLQNGEVEIRSRNNKSFNEKFYPVLEALKQWKVNAVVDGEIVVVNEKGIPDFSNLQEWRSEADGQLAYYVFDLLWLDGKNLMNLPLINRKEMLASLLPAHPAIQLSRNVDTKGKEFYDLVASMDLEGIIAKKADSLYLPDTRSKEWLKIKTEKRHEAVIGGYTVNENTTKKFSALLLGLYEEGEFKFIGPVGTGFSLKTQDAILSKLKPLKTNECPFPYVPEFNKPSRFRPNPPKASVTWVKPQLVAEISYREMNKDGILRHPSFKGLREDKNPQEVVREKAIDTSALISNDHSLVQNKVITSPGKKERKSFLNPKDESQVRNVNGHDLKFSNLSKIYWPKEAYTKRDMLNYYYQVAPFMLPYMKDRPQTLNRHPHGIEGESFYQKDVKGKVPEWIKPFPYHSETDGRDKDFLVCTDESSLLYIASLGCIEMNPWHSRMQHPDNPDWCIIDLDP